MTETKNYVFNDFRRYLFYPPNTFANNTATSLRGRNIILYCSLGRGRRRDINYSLKPIFLRVFPFLVMEPDVFGRYIIITNGQLFTRTASHGLYISTVTRIQRVLDEYDLLKAYGNI